jgi:hypothetical protein
MGCAMAGEAAPIALRAETIARTAKETFRDIGNTPWLVLCKGKPAALVRLQFDAINSSLVGMALPLPVSALPALQRNEPVALSIVLAEALGCWLL